MLPTCQAIYGIERGAEVQAFLELATGQPCPCRQGHSCPLMPSDSVELGRPGLIRQRPAAQNA